MGDTFTKNYNWTKPDVGASDDTWGDKLNIDLDAIDAQLRTVEDGTVGPPGPQGPPGVGFPDAPDNQTYGRTEGAWNLVVPQAGGTFSGQVNFGAGGVVGSNALVFAGSAVCHIPDISQFTLGGGSLGQVPATDGSGNLSWVTPVTGGPYVPISGATMTGALIMQGSNMIALNSPLSAGQSAIIGQKAGINRWQLMIGDYTAEGLNNVGSNFSLVAFSTTGGTLGTWLTIARADGSTNLNGAAVNVAGSMSINGVLLVSNVGNLSVPGGTAGQFLQTNGAGILTWATPAGGGGGIPDAPSNNQTYGRNNAAWVQVVSFPEAPGDGQYYARRQLSWQVIPSGISDAPNDGTAYARKSAAWAHLAHTDITDWTATLAPYALTTALPPASTTTPLADGTAAVGTSTAYARADHVHPVVYMGDNRIINGDMRIDQRNNGASGTTTAYTADRWQYFQAQPSKGIWQRSGPVAGLAPFGFGYFLGFTSSSAYTALAGDYFQFSQAIEADMVTDFAWGTAGAQPVTLSFLVYSSKTGTFGGSITNYASTRSCPFSFSIPTANVWTKIAVTIPGDIAGTWVMSGNAGAMYLNFDLGSGANFRGTAGAWANGNLTTVTGAQSIVVTNGAYFYLTGVKLEVGSVATPYNRQSLAKSMADCQRYYQTVGVSIRAYSAVAAGSVVLATTVGWAMMRAFPTTALITAGTIGNSTGATLNASALNSGVFQIGNSAIGDTYNLNSIYSLSAEL